MASNAALRAAGFIVYRRVKSRFEYLLMQTSYGNHHWSPPKGHVDPGECDLETAMRETHEETGLESEHLCIQNFQKVLEYEVNGKPKTVIYWLAELKDLSTPITMSDEHQDYKWLSLEEACELAAYEDMQKTIRDCETYLQRKVEVE